MKKSVKITIIICAAVIAVAALIFGGIAIHDNSIAKATKESVTASDKIIELDNQKHDIKANEMINAAAPVNIDGGKGIECRFYFENNQETVSITADRIQEESQKIIVNITDCVLFNKSFTLDSKIQVIDTTAPEFTESIDEIEITEGDEINILDYFKAEDLSGDVNLSATEIDNTKIGEQTVTVTATDKNNNSSKKEVKIIVAAKENNNSSSDNSGSGSKSNGGGTNRNTSNSGSKPSGNSNKASDGSSDKSSGGNSSSSGSSSESSGSSGSTSSEEPAQKNVSAKEVQAQVNAYIKSKGITLNSSMTSGNASWNGRIAASQKDLNSGYTIKDCKEDVDYIIKNYGDILSMYCYYDGNYFYILYW